MIFFFSGVVSNIEGDEGVLVPEPRGTADSAAYQEDVSEHRLTRLHQAVSMILGPVSRLDLMHP